MQYDPFQTGQLLLPDAPPAALTGAGEGLSMIASLLVAVSVLLFLLALRSFLNVLPYLSDNILRARGSAALENSVRVSRDRNLVAAVFLIPAILLIYRYKLIDAAILDTLSPDYRLLASAPPLRRVSEGIPDGLYVLHSINDAGPRFGGCLLCPAPSGFDGQDGTFCRNRGAFFTLSAPPRTNFVSELQTFDNFFVPLRPRIVTGRFTGRPGSDSVRLV